MAGVRINDVGLTSKPDPVGLAAAVSEWRVLVTLDTDFGALTAHSSGAAPSVVLFRGEVTRRPASQAALLLANLDEFAEDLDSGAVVVIGDDRVRVRRYRSPEVRTFSPALRKVVAVPLPGLLNGLIVAVCHRSPGFGFVL